MEQLNLVSKLAEILEEMKKDKLHRRKAYSQVFDLLMSETRKLEVKTIEEE